MLDSEAVDGLRSMAGAHKMVEERLLSDSAFQQRSVQLTIVAAISCGILGIQYSRWVAPPPRGRQVLEAIHTGTGISGSRKSSSSRRSHRSPWLVEINLNSANVMELALMPGVGPVLASRIVEDRQERGRFKSVEDLLRVHGIGPRKLAEIRMMAVVNQ